jgi:hypothetical protein
MLLLLLPPPRRPPTPPPPTILSSKRQYRCLVHVDDRVEEDVEPWLGVNVLDGRVVAGVVVVVGDEDEVRAVALVALVLVVPA